MQTYSIKDLFYYVKERSPFYRELYKDFKEFKALSDLPILDSKSFWSANSLHNNQVLTADFTDGFVFKSGGTSGSPKHSYFTKEEWHSFTEAFGKGMAAGGLENGERLADLFYAGDFYASFLFIMYSVEKSGKSVFQLPMGGAIEPHEMLKSISEFKATTWAGVPTTIMKLAEAFNSREHYSPNKILFGGESLYPDQRQYLKSIFPNVRIQSIGYASVDGGLLGFVDDSCGLDEHRCFAETIMEIVDEETGEVINQVGKTGKLLLTNLTRRWLPIIRYPVGDRAQWVEDLNESSNRKFRIMGRSEEGARVGPVSLYFEDVSIILSEIFSTLQTSGFQFVLKHFLNKDELTLRIACEEKDFSLAQSLQPLILEKLYFQRPLLSDAVTTDMIHPVRFEFIQAKDLITQKRTGKLKHMVDLRFEPLS